MHSHSSTKLQIRSLCSLLIYSLSSFFKLSSSQVLLFVSAFSPPTPALPYGGVAKHGEGMGRPFQASFMSLSLPLSLSFSCSEFFCPRLPFTTSCALCSFPASSSLFSLIFFFCSPSLFFVHFRSLFCLSKKIKKTHTHTISLCFLVLRRFSQFPPLFFSSPSLSLSLFCLFSLSRKQSRLPPPLFVSLFLLPSFSLLFLRVCVQFFRFI